MKTTSARSALDVSVIQGGMGVYISTPFLANEVSRLGGLGTVSGTAVERLLVLILQKGDPGGHYRRALAHFPFPEYAEAVIREYFVEGGLAEGQHSKHAPIFTVNPSPSLVALTVCANFAFVWLAKEGHDRPVSINYLEKIALPHVYALTGALLAGVDFVTMGAGIPLAIPGMMKDIVEGREARYTIPVTGEHIKSQEMIFDPSGFFGSALPPLEIPEFIPIIASNLLASVFMKRLENPLEVLAGFVIEEPTAGGHNAPPRGGQSVYGAKDVVDYAKIADIGLPFWIGGSYASPEKLAEARSLGAVGIQAGGMFALCKQSGLRQDIRREVCRQGFSGTLRIETDFRASPTGFPFKVVALEGTLSEPSVRESCQHLCNQGALRTVYEMPDGVSIGYRCPAEPVNAYVHKGGVLADTIGRCCLCNGLINATEWGEPGQPAIVTLGDDVDFLKYLMADADSTYTTEDALAYLLSTEARS